VFHKTEARNRDIFATHLTGQSLQEVAERFQLSPTTVRQIIAMEKYKRAVSLDVYYQALREDDTAAQPVRRKRAKAKAGKKSSKRAMDAGTGWDPVCAKAYVPQSCESPGA